MRKVRVCLLAAFVTVALTVSAVLIGTTPSEVAAQGKVVSPEWRYHDGHWSYWYPGDKRWYYTDGTHWYYEDAGAWRPYAFDRQFGREGFVRGEYRVPGREEKIVVPRHKVYRPG